jgi:plastocyanin
MQHFSRLILVGMAALAAFGLPTIAPAAAGAGVEVELVVSNFRYCPKAPCQAEDYAYMRTPGGPIQGTDNTDKFVGVVPGDVVTWKYSDELCDLTACPGHEVRLENGGQGLTVGSMEAKPGESITWTIPENSKPGDVLRYYCDIQTHWKEGLTGAFKIVASAAPSPGPVDAHGRQG